MAVEADEPGPLRSLVRHTLIYGSGFVATAAVSLILVPVYTHYFIPEIGAPSARIGDLGREWIRAGHQVRVVTCFPNHPAGAYAAFPDSVPMIV